MHLHVCLCHELHFIALNYPFNCYVVKFSLNARVAGLVLPAGFLVATSYAGCNSTLAVAFLVLSVGTQGLVLAGPMVNHIDIAPLFAGRWPCLLL